MSDSAFKSAPYSGYTTRELIEYVAKHDNQTSERMLNEIDRRRKVAAGDVSVMTDGERLTMK